MDCTTCSCRMPRCPSLGIGVGTAGSGWAERLLPSLASVRGAVGRVVDVGRHAGSPAAAAGETGPHRRRSPGVACLQSGAHPLRQRLSHPLPTKGHNGSLKKWKPVTPALAADLTDHVWIMDELLSFRVPPDSLERPRPKGRGLFVCFVACRLDDRLRLCASGGQAVLGFGQQVFLKIRKDPEKFFTSGCISFVDNCL